MAQAVIEVAPVYALGANVSTPAVIHVVFELSFVNEVVTLSSNALESAVLINLPKSALGIVLTYSQMIVDGAVAWCVPDDIICIEHAEFVPFFNTFAKCFAIVQCWKEAWVVLRL